MEPKFQSSFIPKGPVASSVASPLAYRSKEKSLLAFIAVIIFTGSVLVAALVFGYKFYLNYSIAKMANDLELARVALEPEAVSEIIRLNDRILMTEELIGSHLVLSPLFKFLEASTLRSVRFSSFNYALSERGLELTMRGEARGYAVLALQADQFNKTENFENPIFFDFSLDEKGNVIFFFRATVNPGLLSYRREAEKLGVPIVPAVAPVVATTSSATSTPN